MQRCQLFPYWFATTEVNVLSILIFYENVEHLTTKQCFKFLNLTFDYQEQKGKIISWTFVDEDMVIYISGYVHVCMCVCVHTFVRQACWCVAIVVLWLRPPTCPPITARLHLQFWHAASCTQLEQRGRSIPRGSITRTETCLFTEVSDCQELLVRRYMRRRIDKTSGK